MNAMNNMVFCRECGANVEAANFCRVCGAKQVPFASSLRADDAVVRAAVAKIRISAAIWTIIGIIQVILAFSLPIGIWNLVMSARCRKNARLFESGQADIVAYYMAQPEYKYYIWVGINLVSGAFIGVIGAFYDLHIRNFVVNSVRQKEAMPFAGMKYKEEHSM